MSADEQPRIKKTVKQMIREQEERISKIPKATADNPFPDHEHPSQNQLKKFQTKKSPAEYRTNPNGGCDY